MSCRPYVLLALQKMAKSQQKLTSIRTDALDKTFFTVAQRLTTALTNLSRNDALPNHDQQGTDTSQGADLQKSVWKSLKFGSDKTKIRNVL